MLAAPPGSPFNTSRGFPFESASETVADFSRFRPTNTRVAPGPAFVRAP